MAESYPLASEPNRPGGSGSGLPPIIIQNIPPKQPWLGRTFLKLALIASVIGNVAMWGMYQQYFGSVGSLESFLEGETTAKSKIAVIRVSNMITNGAVAAPKKELKTAGKDDDVKAIVLAVDTPGGTISGSDELYHAIEEFKAKYKKPIVVSMQGMATSGGYYISMPADKIIAERSCITGSIGVIASLFEVEDLLKKVGVSPEVMKSGKMKDSGSPFRKMTPEDRQEWQKLIDSMYGQFLEVVLKYRKDKVGGEEKLRKLADGRVYLATEAVTLGLIDGLGYQQDAIEAAKQLAGLSGDVRIVTYSRPADLFSLLEGKSPSTPAGDWTRLLEMRVPKLYLLPGCVFPMPE